MSASTARPWLVLSIAAAVVAVVGSVVALAGQQVYDRLTDSFLAQALAQDLVNLVVISPAMALLGFLALRGSARVYPLWLGTLLFTAYNYVIYTVAIPFGDLFLVWVAVLGLALFALLGGASAVDRGELVVAARDGRAARAGAWALIVVALLFGLLWLSEDVPALLSGETPSSLTDLGLTSNPVHVLDLAFFLPATVLVGAAWLRGSPRAATFGPAFLCFLLLTGLPILATPLVQAARGTEAAWAAAIPVGTITLVTLALLVWLYRSMELGGVAQDGGRA
jgi:hypothetical protein